MDIQDTLYFQIVADVFLCLSMAALVLYLRKINSRNKTAPTDQASVLQFRKLLAESQKDAERFFQTLDECYKTFKELALDLEIREKRLKVLIEEARKQTDVFEIGRQDDDEERDSRRKHAEIMKWLDEGVPLQEIAERTGTTSGEILLIADLEKARRGTKTRAGE